MSKPRSRKDNTVTQSTEQTSAAALDNAATIGAAETTASAESTAAAGKDAGLPVIEATNGAAEQTNQGAEHPGTEQAPAATEAPVVTDAPVVQDTAAADAAAADEAVAELSEVDAAIAAALASQSPVLRSLGTIFTNYHANMGKSKGTDTAVIVEQNLQLWAGLRSMLNDVSVFRDAMRFTLTVFRNNNDGAFDLKLVLRGIDAANSRLNEEHRRAYTGLVTLLTTAAGMNNPKGVSKVVDVAKALESSVFTGDARQRVIGFFAS